MPQAKKEFEDIVGATEGFGYFESDTSASIKTVDETRTILQKAYIEARSVDTIAISSDPDNATLITGVAEINKSGIDLNDILDGSFVNSTGRVLTICFGTVSFYPSQTGPGTPTLKVFSERSTDGGTTWTANEFSRRPVTVSDTEEPYSTKESIMENWQPGELLRFKVFYTGTGSVSLQSQSETVNTNQTITTPSFSWLIEEV